MAQGHTIGFGFNSHSDKTLCSENWAEKGIVVKSVVSMFPLFTLLFAGLSVKLKKEYEYRCKITSS